MYSLDGVALSGSLLASLLNEAASPYAGSEPRKVGFEILQQTPAAVYKRFCTAVEVPQLHLRWDSTINKLSLPPHVW